MPTPSQPPAPAAGAANRPRTVLFASLIGTTIEFYDFYIYATAAVLVFPRLFFAAADPAAATLQSLATFAIAFFARPVGSAVFGHFGDRIGRKATLVAALLTMGLSTVLIGLLPTYASIGAAAPLLLALCRFGQGLGLGGEWGGAVLLATENAPPGKRAWYGMFPQLGAPIGFFLSGATFLLLGELMSDEDFFGWGWRIPFLASALLVAVGLYVRLKITETPDFQKLLERKGRVRLPVATVFSRHLRSLVLGTLVGIGGYVLFYLMTVFALSWGTTQLGFARQEFLRVQLAAIILFALMIPPSALLADRFGRRSAMMAVNAVIAVFGLFYGRLFGGGDMAALALTLALGMFITGFAYGPLGTQLAELFPAEVRYTGASLCFNFAGILGASLAPYVATWLATRHGLAYVGYYLSGAALLSLAALFLVRRPRSRPA
ncbi:MFS transporter [Massilia sp. KIM]|nr:MFS transporter [Massilia sp. KIM]